MFLRIALFEIRFWLRSWMVWIFLFIIGLLIFGAVGTDNVQIGGALSNTYRNAPFVIQNFYSLIGLFTLLMSTAFVNSAAIRDFSYNTYQIIFTTPLRRFDFLLGRFIGATLISVIPMLGVSLGILVAKVYAMGGSGQMGAGQLGCAPEWHFGLCFAECIFHGSGTVCRCGAGAE